MTSCAEGPRDWAEAAEALAGRSRLAGSLHRRHGAPTGLRRRAPADRFVALARAITYQQLSGRAAGTIWSRVEDLVGDSTAPESFVAVSHDELRSAGLSNAKALSLADLAEHAIDGRLDLRATARMGDEQVIEHLTAVRGIGPWSAQMYLISSLGRTDVWPTGDVGVRNGWTLATSAIATPTPQELAEAGEPYRPYRSVLAWWCWQEADTRTPS